MTRKRMVIVRIHKKMKYVCLSEILKLWNQHRLALARL